MLYTISYWFWRPLIYPVSPGMILAQHLLQVATASQLAHIHLSLLAISILGDLLFNSIRNTCIKVKIPL